MQVLDFLRIPALSNIDVDSADRLRLHRRILAEKPMIREVFKEFHATFAECDQLYFSGKGVALEIGAGAGPLRDSDGKVLATDIVYSPHLDCVIDAQRIPLASNSVRAIFAQHCFHHIPDPDRFFGELSRVLVPGGGFAMIEPYFGPVARRFFKRLFASEDFDMLATDWRSADGPMSKANQALSYIVFQRDRALFEQKYPELEIVLERPLDNYLRYLASGGLNFRQLAPDFLTGIIKLAERILRPWSTQLALHHLIVLRKRGFSAPGNETAIGRQ